MKIRDRHGKKLGRIAARGFTLIELLLVMAIIAIVAAMTLPTLQSLMQSVNLAQGGQTLNEQLNLARQIASARNITVEIRLIQLPTVTNGGYNAIQLFSLPAPEQMTGAGTAEQQGVPLAPRVLLPQGMVISQDTTNYSPLLGATMAKTTSATMTVGGVAAPVNYIGFDILPSGLVPMNNTSVEAAQMAKLYLSVVPGRYGTTGAPSNYTLVQLNPNTGTVLVYRP